MSGTPCPHCGLLSIDEEFCDECGKSLLSGLADAFPSAVQETPVKTKWREAQLLCDAVWVPSLPVNTLTCPDLVEVPLDAAAADDGYLLCFRMEASTEDLKTWTRRQGSLSLTTVLQVVRRIGRIISEINRQGYILGSFDLSDFWIKSDDIQTLYLRQTRSFLHPETAVSGLDAGEFAAPEVMHGDVERIGYPSDVLPLGHLFVALLLGCETSRDYVEMRYLAHQLPQFLDEWYVELHYWVGKSTHLDLEQRYPDVDEQMFSLEQILSIQEQRRPAEHPHRHWFRHHVATHVGVGKQHRTNTPEQDGELNQDSHVFLRLQDSERALALVADGISTCKYGSGALASQLIAATAKELWDERAAVVASETDIRQFFEDLVARANERVVTAATDQIPTDEQGRPLAAVASSELMGSTLVAAFFDGDTAYTISLGDSRLYLMAPEIGVNLLHADDNLMSDSAKAGATWEEILQMEQRTSLTRHIGMADVAVWPPAPLPIRVEVKKNRLLEREMLLLCTDGMTDYLTPLGHRSDIWNAETRLDQVLYEETMQECSLRQLVDRLIANANDNGGGDNITVMIVQAVDPADRPQASLVNRAEEENNNGK